MLKVDGMDAAVVGVLEGFGGVYRLCYSYEKLLAEFMRQNDWSRDEAVEWYDYNVIGAYIGETGPLFLIEGDISLAEDFDNG